MFVDTHCHLTKENYDDLEKLIKELEPNVLIINGIDNKTNKEVIELVNKYSHVYGALGIHPDEVEKCSDEDLKFIESNLNNSKIVAIGEVGLDYYWNKENKEKQKDLFKKQITLALKFNKPLIIHSRDAIEDVYNILEEKYKQNSNLKFTLHCYSSSVEMAKRFVKINALFGIGGVLTFKNEKKLKEVVKEISLNNIVLETDSPYLSPEPYRGKMNTPKNILIIAKKIAEIKNVELEKVVENTTKNAISQFDLKV